MNRSLARWLLVLVVASLPASFARAGEWEPAKTWVFAIGCTEWKYDRKLNQSKKARQDAVFVDTLKARGVPTDQIVYLADKQGTIAAIKKQFADMLKKTHKGDFLIFYFQGHGSRDIMGKRSRYYFVNYDAKDEDDKSFLYMDLVFDMIEANFKGSHALMTADCCCSGGMLIEARKRKSHIAYCVLASVFAHNSSTGDWTYTKGLIKGFRGDVQADVNGDGTITFGEMFHAIELDMAYMEKQKSSFVTANGFDPEMKVAKAKKKNQQDVGKFVEAKQDEKWLLAQILDFKDDKFRVLFVDFENDREWVSAKQIRPYKPLHLEERAKVRAKNEDDKWQPAVVKRSLYGLHLVHFDHDKSPNDLLDEWVPADRIKLR